MRSCCTLAFKQYWNVGLQLRKTEHGGCSLRRVAHSPKYICKGTFWKHSDTPTVFNTNEDLNLTVQCWLAGNRFTLWWSAESWRRIERLKNSKYVKGRLNIARTKAWNARAGRRSTLVLLGLYLRRWHYSSNNELILSSRVDPLREPLLPKQGDANSPFHQSDVPTWWDAIAQWDREQIQVVEAFALGLICVKQFANTSTPTSHEA